MVHNSARHHLFIDLETRQRPWSSHQAARQPLTQLQAWRSTYRTAQPPSCCSSKELEELVLQIFEVAASGLAPQNTCHAVGVALMQQPYMHTMTGIKDLTQLARLEKNKPHPARVGDPQGRVIRAEVIRLVPIGAMPQSSVCLLVAQLHVEAKQFGSPCFSCIHTLILGLGKSIHALWLSTLVRTPECNLAMV